jgi:hypothetical protein
MQWRKVRKRMNEAGACQEPVRLRTVAQIFPRAREGDVLCTREQSNVFNDEFLPSTSWTGVDGVHRVRRELNCNTGRVTPKTGSGKRSRSVALGFLVRFERRATVPGGVTLLQPNREGPGLQVFLPPAAKKHTIWYPRKGNWALPPETRNGGEKIQSTEASSEQ